MLHPRTCEILINKNRQIFDVSFLYQKGKIVKFIWEILKQMGKLLQNQIIKNNG